MMSKLLALAFVGVAAATNHSGNGTHTTAGSSVTSGPTGPAGGADGPGSDLNRTSDSTLTGTQASVVMKATVALTLPANVTASDMTGLTIATTACELTPQTGAAAQACGVETALSNVFKAVDASAVTAVQSIATARRRSLTEASSRRLTATSLKFTTKVTATSVEAANGIVFAAKQTSFETDFAAQVATMSGITASVTKLEDTDFSTVCQVSGCAAANPVAYTAPTTSSSGSSSDAFKTGLGLAAAVVSGLFLF